MYQFSKSDEKNIYDPKGNELARFIKKKNPTKKCAWLNIKSVKKTTQ